MTPTIQHSNSLRTFHQFCITSSMPLDLRDKFLVRFCDTDFYVFLGRRGCEENKI